MGRVDGRKGKVGGVAFRVRVWMGFGHGGCWGGGEVITANDELENAE